MKKWLRRLAILMGAIVALVGIAFLFAWWATTPPTEQAPPPEGTVVLAAPEGPLKVGAAAVDITPVTSQYLAGLGFNRVTTGVHDPIYARALALERGDVRLVLVVLDLIGLHHHYGLRVRDRLKNLVRPEALLVLTTHDHSAPDTLGLWGPHPFKSGIDPAYLDFALEGAAKAAEQAVASLRPARLTLGRGKAPDKGVSKNNRDPGVFDRDVTVIAADDFETGKPIATVVNFACHPEVMMGKNTLITADFPGALIRTVEAKRGGVGIFWNGPLGGMVTADVQGPRSFQEVDRIGGILGEVALSSLTSPDSRRVETASLVWVHKPILVPIQNRRFIAGSKLGILDRPFEKQGYALSEVDALRLGPLLLATVPGEALPRVGFELKEAMGFPFSAVIGLAGDELGYIIPEDAFPDPQRYRYEKTVSPGPLATTLIRGSAIQAISLAKETKP